MWMTFFDGDRVEEDNAAIERVVEFEVPLL